jgi:23S rRNA (cytosine1962-C5)-methyltransferase
MLPVVTLKSRRAQPFFNRHPWVFAGAIARTKDDPIAGAEVRVHDHEGRFIARGLFNPQSNIRVRLYSWDEHEALDQTFWSARLDEAIALRKTLFPKWTAESACRLVYSEADGLSGLVVERYGDWLVVQFTSLALSQRQEMFVRLLTEKLQPRGIQLRTEKGIRELEGLEQTDGLLSGDPPPRPMFIEENGLRFGVDLTEGQKTGYYLDQRDNRAAAARYMAGHRVLDMFCYGGGFGLAALKLGGAKFVQGVDVSASAITLAEGNAELNSLADHCRFEKAKAFDELERLVAAEEKFDTVILDPPKLARHRGGLNKALRGYHSLNRLAVDLIPPGGILVTCSCSGLVGRPEFEGMLADVATKSNRRIRILESRSAAADHPTSVHCFETDYLKCYICRVD